MEQNMGEKSWRRVQAMWQGHKIERKGEPTARID